MRSHVVGLLRCQDGFHEVCTVDILLGTPVVPRVLSIVEVGEDSDFEGAIMPESQSWLIGVWVELNRLEGPRRPKVEVY